MVELYDLRKRRGMATKRNFLSRRFSTFGTLVPTVTYSVIWASAVKATNDIYSSEFLLK